jgi:peptidoglycan L-alanyl-D-glutamate endopeptidase CwlK
LKDRRKKTYLYTLDYEECNGEKPCSFSDFFTVFMNIYVFCRNIYLVSNERRVYMADVKKICKDVSELSSNAQKACEMFMADCKKNGLKVRITETYRSQERQNYLYEQGRTRPGNIVTWTKNSRHTSRRAWDICKDVKGQEYSDSGFFKKCGDIASDLGITWGGKWKQADTPHFEISKGWKLPAESEEIDMEEVQKLKEENEFLKAAVDKLADRVTALENPMIYNYIDKNMPEWAAPTIQMLVDKGVLAGNEKGELGLTGDMLRLLVMLERDGIFDK